MATNGTVQNIPVTTNPTPMPPDEANRALENICITLAVLSLVAINVLLFLFWRYKALGKLPLKFHRYSSDYETYASLHEPVIRKDTVHVQPPSRVQEILKRYASTVAYVGQNKALSGSNNSLCVSSSDSRGSLIVSDSEYKRSATSERRRPEDKQGILANEQEPGRDGESSEYDDASVRFRVGHPEEDSPTTCGESDYQVYCEVMNFPSKRYGCHFRPISFEYCKDKEEVPVAQKSPNNNTLAVNGHAADPDSSENIYENFRRRRPTSPFASVMKSTTVSSPDSLTAPYATCRTISGEYATCDANGDWRPTSFTFCHDVTTPTEQQFPSTPYHVNDENATYEQFMEPNDPIYSQTVIRRSQRSKRGRPTPLPRESLLSAQPIYEQPSFEQPLYENIEPNDPADEVEVDHRLNNSHLDVHITGHLAASDSRLNVTSASHKHPSCGPMVESRNALTSQISTESSHTDAPSAPHDGPASAANECESHVTANKSSFHTIAREFAGLHEEYMDDYDPEETFPVMQMLSDRYSTGNFLNKFY